MSRGRAVSARGRSSRLTWLLGLGLLSILGFGGGLVAGAVWEQPGLVLSHLMGGTQAVEWGADRKPALATAVPRERPLGAAREPAPKRKASAKTEPASPPPVAAAPPAVAAAPPAPASGRLAVQVGAFAESRLAEELADRLRGQGYPVYVKPGAATGEARWRVRVGPLPTRDAADRAASRLKQDEELPTWVLDEDAG